MNKRFISFCAAIFMFATAFSGVYVIAKDETIDFNELTAGDKEDTNLYDNIEYITAEGFDEPIPMEKVIENSNDERSVSNLSENTSPEEFDKLLSEESMEVLKEEAEFNDRYIIKYKNNDKNSRDEIKESSKNAFNKGKLKKEKTEEERLEKFKEANAKELNNLRFSSKINENQSFCQKIQELFTGVEIESASLPVDSDEYEVIILPDSVNAAEFVQDVSNESGDVIEFIQPDYIMELSDNDTEPKTTIEIKENEISSDSEKDIDADENTIEDPVATNEHTEGMYIQEIDAEQISEPEESVSPISTAMPNFNSENQLYDIDADLNKAWSVSKGEGAVVAVIDTGVDVNHPELFEKIVDGWDFYNNRSEVYNEDLGFDQAHGTHVAGIIAKAAPEAKIMPLKVFENGKAYTSDIIKAIEYAKDNGATIVNCSFGSSDNNQALKDTMEQSNLFFVCAAGNHRTNIDETPVYPAAFSLENSISVAALNQDLGMSYFSNYGIQNVDISAWGRDVYSCFPNGEYGTMNGTSMSAAYVSGAAALISGTEYNKNLKETLKSTSDKLSCLDGKVSDGNKLNFSNLVYGTSSNEIIDIVPEDDFNVLESEKTPSENWELFNSEQNQAVSTCGYNTIFLKSNGTVWEWNNSSSEPTRVVGLTNITAVSAGVSHSIALKSDKTVWSWGANTYGQCGVGNTNYQDIPIKVSISNVKAISANNTHSLAVKQDGTVAAWGKNDFGQLGTGTLEKSLYPITAIISDVKYISTGFHHTLAVKNDETVWAWGNNSNGQLGDGTYDSSESPVQVVGLDGISIKEISAGSDHSVAVTNDNYVFTWGSDNKGQLGDGKGQDRNNPAQIYIDNVKSVSAGGNYTIALKYDGSVWGWGYGELGALGTGDTIISTYPVKTCIESVSNISAESVTLLIKNDGTAWICGDNYSGNAFPHLVSGEGDKVYNSENMASGFGHTIYKHYDGTVLAWGDNTYGQLGDGSVISTDSPVVVELEKIHSVAAGDDFSLALDYEGDVYAWGRNVYGQIGENTSAYINKPKKISNLSNIVKIAANGHNCLALDKDGRVYAWGLNTNGQLGIDSTEPYISKPTQINGLPKVMDIAAGKSHSLAVEESGTVWGWGNNNYYKLGFEGSGNYSKPEKTGIDNVLKIYAGNDVSAALNGSNRVLTWGSNLKGQLGVSDIQNNTSRAQMVSIYNVREVITKNDHIMIFNYNGRGYSWGDNTYGQLGNTKDTFSNIPTSIGNIECEYASVNSTSSFMFDGNYNLYKWGYMPNSNISDYSTELNGSCVPLRVPFDGEFVQVDAKRNSVVALDANGDVYTWGDGSYWDLGHGSADNSNVYYPKKVEGLPKIKQVAKGKNHTLALDIEGNVWGWGNNSSGELGSNLKGKVYVPTKISGINNATFISAGEGFSAAIVEGDIWTWGNNSYGRLGRDKTVPYGVPGKGISMEVKFSSIDCGQYFTVAKYIWNDPWNDEDLGAWGRNNSGQLGVGDEIDRLTLCTPHSLDGYHTIELSAGREHVLALQTDGEVYSWGRNSVGQLGLGDKNNYNEPMLIPNFRGIVFVEAAYEHSIAIKEDGTVYTWGEGRDGQMGNGNRGTSRSPVKVSGISNAKSASGGNSFTCVLDKNGKLFSFGDNTYGQLGVMSYVPVKVNFWDSLAAPELTVKTSTYNSVTLTWTAAAGGTGNKKYDVYLNGVLKESDLSDTSYTFTGLNPVTNYAFKVIAKDAVGVSAESNTVNVSTQAHTYIVKFNANGGNGTMQDQSFTYDVSQALAANIFVKKGYTFEGWATSPNGSVVYKDKASVRNLIESGVYNLYAVWQPNTYIVKYNANGGNGIMPDESFTYDVSQELTANTFSRDGYIFEGWATSPNGSVVYTDKASIENVLESGVYNLYAIWKSNTYSVKYNANGGDGTMPDQRFTYNVAQNLMANTFTRTGYEFKGWSRTATGKAECLNKQEVNNLTVSDAIIELYAVWDDYGDTQNAATVKEVDTNIFGKINYVGDVDFLKFVTPETGYYEINQPSGINVTVQLFTDKLVNPSEPISGFEQIKPLPGANDNVKWFGYLEAEKTYTIQLSAATVGAIGDYSINIAPIQDLQGFDIFDYDMEINEYKQKIKSICRTFYSNSKYGLSQEVYNKLEMVNENDLLLHEMPDFLKNISSADDYDEKIKTFFAAKKTDFENLKQAHLSIISEYSDEEAKLEGDITTPQMEFEENAPSVGAMAPLMFVEDNEESEANEIELEQSGMAVMAAAANPQLTISSTDETSITYNVTYPTSGAKGNAISLIDFNNGETKETIPYNGIYEASGTNTISGLVPGGMYIVGMHWSTDSGKTYGAENSIYRRVQLPPIREGDKISVTSPKNKIKATLERDDKVLAANANFDRWLSNMDTVYSKLTELTGYTPYGGDTIEIRSTRSNINQAWPDGTNTWVLAAAYAGNPAMFSRPFNRSLMMRLSDGDWSDAVIHEISHDFDQEAWAFDYEVLANLKSCYVLENTPGIKIYDPGVKKYYTGDDIYNYYNSDNYSSYNQMFAKGLYDNLGMGMTAVMLRIKQDIGWQAFKDTFHDINEISSEESDYIYRMHNQVEIGKFNIFITKLKDYSGNDIIRKLTEAEKNIIEKQYGGKIEYFTGLPESIGVDGSEANINAPAGKYVIRRFIPSSTGSYDIYTAPYSGTGAANDTVLEVYADDYLGVLLAKNDNYGGSTFSKVTLNLDKNQNYFIKVSNKNSKNTVHADLRVSKSPETLTLNNYYDSEVSGIEISKYKFTPSTAGEYIFTTGAYNNGTQSLNKDIILELYEDEALTKRIAVSRYKFDEFPQIGVNLKAGTTYYLTFAGYLGKTAKARINVKQPLSSISSITSLEYNDGQGPKLGTENTLKFTINRTVATNEVFRIVPYLGWDNMNFYEKQANGSIQTLSGKSTEITLNNIELSSAGNDVLYTKLRIYGANASDSTLLWEGPNPAVEKQMNNQSNVLEFSPVGDGKYLFSNNPETITSDFIANGRGDKNWLMRNPGLTSGNYTLAMYHHTNLGSPITVDAEFWSTGGANITITNIGVQRPDNALEESGGWAAINGYADYRWLDGVNINSIGSNGRRTNYNLPRTYYIQDDRLWLSKIYNDVYGADYWKIGETDTPIFVMIDFTVDGEVDVNTLAYTGTQGSPNNINWNGEANYVFDTHHKGVSPSLPQVNTNLNFSISDTTHPDGTNLTVKTVNNANPNGCETHEWATHVNPQENPYCIDVGVQSDLLPLEYYDSNPESGKPSHYGDGAWDDQKTKETWIFDVNRTQIRSINMTKNSNGKLIEHQGGNIPYFFKPNDLLSNTTPDTRPSGMSTYDIAVPLGNWGVIENYTLAINNSGKTRYLTYKLDCNSAVVVKRRGEYKLSPKNNDTSYERWFNLGEIKPGNNVINFSICMPTADNGWFRNQLIISDTPAND